MCASCAIDQLNVHWRTQPDSHHREHVTDSGQRPMYLLLSVDAGGTARSAEPPVTSKRPRCTVGSSAGLDGLGSNPAQRAHAAENERKPPQRSASSSRYQPRLGPWTPLSSRARCAYPLARLTDRPPAVRQEKAFGTFSRLGAESCEQQKDVTVEIKRHTMAIGGQIYQLGNIARVQNLEFKPNRSRILGTLVRRALAAFAILVVLKPEFSGSRG